MGTSTWLRLELVISTPHKEMGCCQFFMKSTMSVTGSSKLRKKLSMCVLADPMGMSRVTSKRRRSSFSFQDCNTFRVSSRNIWFKATSLFRILNTSATMAKRLLRQTMLAEVRESSEATRSISLVTYSTVTTRMPLSSFSTCTCKTSAFARVTIRSKAKRLAAKIFTSLLCAGQGCSSSSCSSSPTTTVALRLRDFRRGLVAPTDSFFLSDISLRFVFTS
mmetsp:Transcript_64622/g.151466  ORF Transcript_64622/g.151466 Transcript_64622/m.151466 type:complete len:220 (-) Transcript_64622:1384-2043(-)